MASIKCTCGYAIHYHGEPCGIEYIWISLEDWREITSTMPVKNSGSNRTHKGGYPIYRSDTIEDDFEGKIVKVWRCPNCGTVMKFNKLRQVVSYLEPCEPTDPVQKLSINEEINGILYDDDMWDRLTEMEIPDCEIERKMPPKLFTRSMDGVVQVITSDNMVNVCYAQRAGTEDQQESLR